MRIFIAQIHHEAKVEEEKRKQLRALAQKRTHSDAKSNGAMRPIEGTNLSDGDKKEKLDAQKLQLILKQRHSANLKQRQPLGPSVSTFRPLGWRGGTKPMDGDKTEILDARKLQVLLKQKECGISFKDHAPFTFGSVKKQPARVTQAGLSAVQQQHQSASDRGKYRQDQQEMDELAAFRLKSMTVADELIEDGDMEVLPLKFTSLLHAYNIVFLELSKNGFYNESEIYSIVKMKHTVWPKFSRYTVFLLKNSAPLIIRHPLPN